MFAVDWRNEFEDQSQIDMSSLNRKLEIHHRQQIYRFYIFNVLQVCIHMKIHLKTNH